MNEQQRKQIARMGRNNRKRYQGPSDFEWLVAMSVVALALTIALVLK